MHMQYNILYASILLYCCTDRLFENNMLYCNCHWRSDNVIIVILLLYYPGRTENAVTARCDEATDGNTRPGMSCYGANQGMINTNAIIIIQMLVVSIPTIIRMPILNSEPKAKIP